MGGEATGTTSAGAMGPGPTLEDVPLGAIDPAPAYAVRAERHPDAIDELAAAYKARKKVPAADVFAHHDPAAGKTLYLLADGGHRFEARKAGRFDALRCLVRYFPSAAEAEAAAYAHAAGANAHEGSPVRRSAADKRAAVEAVVGRPEYAAASDNKLAQLCGVSGTLVRSVREALTHAGRLTGRAAAGPDRYTGTKAGADRWFDGKGNIVDYDPARGPAARTPDPGPPASSSVTPADIRTAGRPGGPAGPEPDPAPVEPADPGPTVVRDEKGRAVPPALIVVFGGRTWFRGLGNRIGAILGEVEAGFGAPHGAALKPIAQELRRQGKEFGLSVRGGMPFVVCPDLADEVPEAGLAAHAGCTHCSGRGWLSRLRYDQLPNGLKARCRAIGAGPGAGGAAGDPAPPPEAEGPAAAAGPIEGDVDPRQPDDGPAEADPAGHSYHAITGPIEEGEIL